MSGYTNASAVQDAFLLRAGNSLPLILTFVCKLLTSSSFMYEIKCVETFHQEYQ